MKLHASLFAAAMALAAGAFLSGCVKAFDYLKNHPGENARLCQVKKLKIGWQFVQPEINIIYNAEGNPLHMLAANVPQFYPISEYHFRYDRHNRLTDYFFNYYGAVGVLTWDRYSYPNKNTVIDSGWAYTGRITDSIPPNDPTKLNRLAIISLDASGRIIKTSERSADPANPWYVTEYTYNAQGNLVRPGAIYDNKINPYQTNKVWMFVFKDYSVNNPLTPLYTPVPITITSYNQAGLPLQLKSGNEVGASIFGYGYVNMGIEYDCDWSQSPGKW